MAHDSKYEKRARSRSVQNNRSAQAAPGSWQGWVNVALPDGAKKQWFEWSKDPAHFFDAFAAMCFDGYKLTIKWEERSSAYSAFCTPADGGHRDAGWGLSERAGDPFTALNRLVYIHAVILGGDWQPYKQPTGYHDDWNT